MDWPLSCKARDASRPAQVLQHSQPLSTTILSMATLLLIRTNNVEEFLAMRLYQWSSATSISLRIAEDVCQQKMINQDQ